MKTFGRFFNAQLALSLVVRTLVAAYVGTSVTMSLAFVIFDRSTDERAQALGRRVLISLYLTIALLIFGSSLLWPPFHWARRGVSRSRRLAGWLWLMAVTAAGVYYIIVAFWCRQLMGRK